MDTRMKKLPAAQERALQQKNEADRKAKQARMYGSVLPAGMNGTLMSKNRNPCPFCG